MTNIIFVRHAESEFNAQRRWQGQANPDLSSKGKEDALRAARNLEGFTGEVWTSSLTRAQMTAEIICDELGFAAPIVTEPFREIDVGAFSGKTIEEINREFPELEQKLREGRLAQFPDGESRLAHLRRVCGGIDDVCAAATTDEVLLITHGGVMSALERAAGVYPGVPIPHLSARSFDCPSIIATSDRIDLLVRGLVSPT